MITENIVIGALLVVMAGVQTWLRFGPWAKEQQASEREVAARRAEAAQVAVDDGDDPEGADGDDTGGATRSSVPGSGSGGPVMMDRGSRLWNKWTAILGPLGIVVGIALMIWGAVGGE